ncbi:MAG: hypothetical protein JWQ49_409 [Edaphobacter sp.]|nr:hypothetical protein [Edaphobacter sp.]
MKKLTNITNLGELTYRSITEQLLGCTLSEEQHDSRFKVCIDIRDNAIRGNDTRSYYSRLRRHSSAFEKASPWYHNHDDAFHHLGTLSHVLFEHSVGSDLFRWMPVQLARLLRVF